jgi:hypothetical protein
VHNLAWAQASLNKLGFTPVLYVSGTPNPQTKMQLKRFQQRAGITIDGLYGPQTEGALMKALDAQTAAPTATSAPSGNPLAGKPYHYLIGTDGNLPGADGTVTEPGYDATQPPSKGVGVAYGNLFDEKNSGQYGPYRHSGGTAQEYGEGEIDPDGNGWDKNIHDQLTRRKNEGWKFIEWDNPDAYPADKVIEAVHTAETYGIGVVAKNAGLLGASGGSYLAHPNVYALIVEAGAGKPAEMDVMRRAVGKPLLPTTFVFFGPDRAQAQQYAGQIKAGKFPEMRVTYSSSGEYGSSEEIT